MSNAVAATLPIGPVQVYWNGVRIGSMKSQATIRHTKESVQQGLQDSGVNVIEHTTKEVCEVDVVIDDFKMSQMRYVYANAQDYEAKGTIKSWGYTSTSTVVFRFEEEHKLSGTANTTVDRTGFDESTIHVWKSDWSTQYTRGTDFTCTGSGGTVARIGAGSITDQTVVHVIYDQSATTDGSVGSGGELAGFEAVLKLVHVLDSGKVLQFWGYRAKKIGASDLAISMAAEFSGIPMTFHLLGDLTQKPGYQLFHWDREA